MPFPLSAAGGFSLERSRTAIHHGRSGRPHRCRTATAAQASPTDERGFGSERMTGFVPVRQQGSAHRHQPRNNKEHCLGVVGTLRWHRCTAGVQSSGRDPVIRGDPKPPLSVGPARAAVARCRWGRPERLSLRVQCSSLVSLRQQQVRPLVLPQRTHSKVRRPQKLTQSDRVAPIRHFMTFALPHPPQSGRKTSPNRHFG